MNNKLVIVFDCGATNVRAVAIDAGGQIRAMHALPNATQVDKNYLQGLIWDADEIWQKFVLCTRKLLTKINPDDVTAITVTTFGVNGTPVDKNGKLLYPVISWQCNRTVSIMKQIAKYMPVEELYGISGVNEFSFNTIYTLVWLKENKPEVLSKMEGFLFMPSIFVNKLTGNLINDVTMAGTSMLTDLKERHFSNKILTEVGIPQRFFEVKEPGSIAGTLLPNTAKELGLSSGLPVVITGHDTQFALIGSGAGENDVVLSSGTWEILMTRCRNVSTDVASFKKGLTNEFDALPGLYNTGVQWLASGVLEWVKNMFYTPNVLPGENIYDIMIREASEVKWEDNKVKFSPDFINHAGSIAGINLKTSRQQIYRAAIESLVNKTGESLKLLEKTGKLKATSLIVVGGGAKNELWNQLRANRLGIPVKITEQSETTVLGASLFAHAAVGNLKSVDEGMKALCRNYRIVKPNVTQ